MNTVNVLFVMVASVLVFFMTPGLALFYGGLVSKKNTVDTFLSVFCICGVAVVLWVAIGYSMSFSGNLWGLIGNLHNLFMRDVHLGAVIDTGIPVGVFALFQMMFAIITPALFVGAIVGRVRMVFLTIFIICWSILVYYPLVHMVWGSGILAQLGVLDFAGGTVVHVNAGVTALVLSTMVGPRLHPENSHDNLSLVLIGTAILWIGWYGFNAGSALAINDVAIQAMLTTTVASAFAMATWQVLEFISQRKITLVGTCTGAICGLVAITPAAGYVTFYGAAMIGLGGAILSFLFITLVKPRLHCDDPLDAFGCHGVSGIWGSIATGLFATKSVNKAVVHNGLIYGGGLHQLVIQLVATVGTMIFTAIMVWAIIVVLKKFVPMRVSARDEALGLDLTQHGETITTL